MPETIRWHIGPSQDASRRLDRAPYRAYFYWIRDEVLTRAADYSVSELTTEIARQAENDEVLAMFAEAIARLDRT